MTAGRLFGVGVGPGDPELLTLKAVRILREADVIAVPGKDKESCVAYRIAAAAVPEIGEKEAVFVEFPMTKDPVRLKEGHEKAAAVVGHVLSEGKTAAFVTLGDPSVYSTYIYLAKRIREMGFETEMVSGIPSFCAAAARAGIGLGEKDEAIHILPGSYPVGDGLALSGTKILMKSGRQIGAVKQELLEHGMDAVMVTNCGMAGEAVFWGAEKIPENAGYYSLVIAREPQKEAERSESLAVHSGGWSVRIGTRKSALAMAQSQLAADVLREAYPGLSAELVPVVTQGDTILDKPLAQFGGKGIFIQELERELLDGSLDLAVHSAKDLPVELAKGLGIAAVLRRADPADVLVTVAGRKIAGETAVIGTGSLRRQAQLNALLSETSPPRSGDMRDSASGGILDAADQDYAALREAVRERLGGRQAVCRQVRGNVDTRLGKLWNGEFDGLILAAAGLSRLQLLEDPRFCFTRLSADSFIPAGGQGILAIEARRDSWIWEILRKINDPEAERALLAERRFLETLGAGCHAAVGAYGSEKDGVFTFRAMYETKNGVVIKKASCRPEDAGKIGKEAAKRALSETRGLGQAES